MLQFNRCTKLDPHSRFCCELKSNLWEHEPSLFGLKYYHVRPDPNYDWLIFKESSER